MGDYLVKEITKYLTPNLVFVLEINHLNNGRWIHVFSDLNQLGTYFCDWYQVNILKEYPFYLKGADILWNGPVECQSRSEFLQHLTQGYHSGFLDVYHQNHKVSIWIMGQQINPTT